VPRRPILCISNLRLERGDTVILDGIDWRVDPGQHWVILGPNGSGKTTLLAAITGYKTPTDGDIQLLGQTFGESHWPELRKKIGLVSSALNKLMAPAEPALETIISGKYAMIDLWHTPTPADRRAARAILKRIECLPLADRPWQHLSQGERQRILIGRALMAKPKLLILDEPCAGLDPVAREHFLQFLNRLARQPKAPALVLVTHHVEEIMPAFTHALLLKEGKVCAIGPLKKTLTSKNLGTSFGNAVKLERKNGRYTLKVKPARKGMM
jgi:iron complex transport system ATP-binding protein